MSSCLHRRQRGLSLVESLVSFAVAAIGMTALLIVESQLHRHADLTRQRAESVRLAQAELERLRSFASTDQLRALPASLTRLADAGSNTGFSLVRSLQPGPGLLQGDVDVRWSDRQGRAVTAQLHGIVAEADPALSGYLVTRRAGGTAHLPRNRSLAVPPQAVDLGDGRSAFAPPGAAGITWIFDNRSGEVVGLCSQTAGAAAPGDGGECQSAHGLVVSGYVRFSTGPTVGPDDAAHPTSPALDLSLQLRTADGNAQCFNGPGPEAGSVAYHCLVALAPGRIAWGGRLDVQPAGWSLGTQAGQYRVCRYSADQDRRGDISNAEHPLDYRNVSTPLAHQNFLVVRGPNRCPADAARGAFVDRNTVEQAPQPEETPLGA